MTLAGDVARAQKLDCLHVYRAAEPGLQPSRPTRIVNARTLVSRYRIDPRQDRCERAFRIGRERFRIAVRKRPEQAISGRGRFKAPIEESSGE